MAGIIVKKHMRAGTLVLAICDKDLLGKKFENEIMLLDLSSTFYRGEETSEQEIESLLRSAQSAHIVGTESITFAQKIFPEITPTRIGNTIFATLLKL